MRSQEFVFHSPVKARFGYGVKNMLVGILHEYTKIAVVSGKTVLDVTGMRNMLKDAFVRKELFFFCEVEANPSIVTVERIARQVREHGCQVVLACGGGSSLDAGKAVAALAVNHGEFHGLLDLNVMPIPPLPVIAVPTTCGTGSEMNHYAIVTDTSKKDKLNFSAENMFPKYALLDPALLCSLDPSLVLATAFDALTHALEGYVSLRANPFSDVLAMNAMERIISLLVNESDPKSSNALAGFLYASSLAGIVILHTGTTLLHSLGYYLTNNKGIQHGAANALLLPYYIKMLERKGVEKFQHIRALFSRYGLKIEDFLEKIGCDSLASILSREERFLMIKYAIGKKNAQYTPFTVERDFLEEMLSG